MDLMSEETIGAFGVLITEAISGLVDDHDQSLDKRASMLKVEAPSLNRNDADLEFNFKVLGNRQAKVDVQLLLSPDVDDDDEEFATSPFSVAIAATPRCQCKDFKRDFRCSHTLAAAWWLQEQLGRHSAANVLELLGTLQSDPCIQGRDLVDGILELANAASEKEPEQETRIQWRIATSDSRYYCPISITPYEQRPRKNGKGWTKGREIRSYDLMNRDFFGHHVDGEIAGLIMDRSYSFENDHFAEFQALKKLIGHPNVAWDDAKATPITIRTAEICFALERVDIEGDEPSPLEPKVDNSKVRFRPVVQISDLNVDPENCNIVFGYASPVEPLVVIVDERNNTICVCPLRDVRAARMVQYLLESDLSDVLLDAETASRFSVGSMHVDSLVSVKLPEELAGPIEDANTEIIIELRPREGAGLFLALKMFESRFRESISPGAKPDIVPCLTEEGPVRLRRNLNAEIEQADHVTERFALGEYFKEDSYSWIVETDSGALELLARLYDGGDDTPRMDWPDGQTLRVRGEITPSALRVQIDDRKDWFGLGGVISIDGQEVKLEDLLSAVRDRRSLVKVGDREFARISETFRKRLEQLGDALVSERGSLRVADAAVPAVQELLGDDVTLEASARWHRSLERLESLADWTPEQPDALDAKLRDYQLDGYRWLARLSQWGVGGVLADDMGLGKTVQALGVLLDRKDEGPALVIAPTSVGDNWVRECERFTPDLSAKLYRDSDRDDLIKTAGPGDLVIASYQLVQRDADRFTSRPWNTLVLDEAQFIKNSQTKTSQAIRKIDAQWRLGLSGTPLENHLGELWSLFRTLSPGLLGSWERFRKRFAEPIERQKDQEQRESLAGLVRPFILRRTKDKVLSELPPRTEVTLQAELSDEEQKRYQDARLAAVAELSGAVETQKAGEQRMRTLAWLTKLRQLACHPRLVDPSWSKGSAKLDLLMTLIDELRDGEHRALVFSQFVKHLSVIRQSLDKQGIKYQYLDGATPAKERQRRVDAFQGGEGDLFLISLKAGGTGLNLTAADYVIHLDPWWNPAVEDQATDRAHRIGQERPVTVYRLVAKGTIEEQILEMHADKRELVAGVLDGTDRAGKLETEDLIKMIREGVTQS